MGGCISGSNNNIIIKAIHREKDESYLLDFQSKKFITKTTFSMLSTTNKFSRNKLPLENLCSTNISSISVICSENDINDINSIREAYELFDKIIN